MQCIARLAGPVVHGFKRGSKLLGCAAAAARALASITFDARAPRPTANLGASDAELEALAPGVYIGFATVAGQGPYKAAISVGWNPFFKNEKKTIEAYLLHEFDSDFYDAPMRLILARFLRPETSFPSMEALIAAITADVENARAQLDEEGLVQLGREPFLFEEGAKL